VTVNAEPQKSYITHFVLCAIRFSLYVFMFCCNVKYMSTEAIVNYMHVSSIASPAVLLYGESWLVGVSV